MLFLILEYLFQYYERTNFSVWVMFFLQVSDLFQGHDDLLVDFTHFLPDTSSAPSVHNAQSGRNHNLLGDDRGSLMTITRPARVEKVV